MRCRLFLALVCALVSVEAGVAAVSINSRITGVNAYLRWCGVGYKLQFLKEPERVLPILGSAELMKLIRHRTDVWQSQ